MRNLSNAFKRLLYDGNRNYICRVVITLSDNTELELGNSKLWQNGIEQDDNISDTTTFSALGSVCIGSVTIIINNIYDEYSDYDFSDAKVVPYIGLTVDGALEEIKLGEYTVDNPTYNGALISLYCLDNMAKFDKPYTNSSLVYPATLQSIVTNACIDCGVTLGTTTFPNYTFEIATRPTSESITYREIISYAATVAGCFARCNNNGRLELKWFDADALNQLDDFIDGGIFDGDTPYSTGDSVNGGIFNPWETADSANGGLFTDPIYIHYITALTSQNISIDDVIITGVQIQVKTLTEDSSQDLITNTYGTDDYVIKLQDNPFITVDNVATIGAYLQQQLVGLKFRQATIEHLNDPSIEAGDVALVWDRKGNVYPILITNTEFTVDAKQRTTSAADTPLRNSATRFTEATKTYVESRKLVKQEAGLREQLETDLTAALNAKSGMYETRVQESGGGYTYYMHDKPVLAQSTAVIKITNEAVGVTPNYQASPVQWYGLTVDGNFIANIMSVIGIDFDWGTGGSLILGGQSNQNGTLTIKDASNNTIGYWNNTGLDVSGRITIKGYVNQDNGIYFEDSDGIKTGSIGTNVDKGITLYTNRKYIYITALPEDSFEQLSVLSIGSTSGYREWDLYGQYLSTNYTVITRGFSYRPSLYGEYIFMRGDLYTGDKLRFATTADRALLTNKYNSTDYNLIRNHGNGNISVSASSAGLYLGYENTTFVNFLNGKMSLNSDGFLTILNGRVGTASDSSLFTDLNQGAITVRYGTYNALQMIADSDGKVRLWRRRADNNSFNLISCANNSDAVTTSGNWTFLNSVATNGNLIATSASGERQICAYGGTTNRIYLYANSDGRVGLYSFRADGTAVPIIGRPNNSNAISAGGNWTFSGSTLITDYSGTTRRPACSVTADGNRIAYFQMSSNTQVTVFGQNGTAGSAIAGHTWNVSSSDIRLKEHIEDTKVTALDALNAIRLRAFDWKADHDHWRIGMIADEVEKIDPKFAVGGGEEDGVMNVKSIDTFYMMGYVIKAIQELSAENKKLKEMLKERN